MRTCHSQKKRWFPNADKSDPVMNDNNLKPKVLHGLLGNLSQLMLGHLPVRFIVDPFDFASIFKSPHDSPKIDHRSCVDIVVLWRRIKRRFSQ